MHNVMDILKRHEMLLECELALPSQGAIFSRYNYIESYSERDLEIFSTPDTHAHIIGSDVIEVLSIYGKQSSSHCRRFHLPNTGVREGRGRERGQI